MIQTLDVIAYSIVIIREIVCIAIIVALLNDLEVKSVDLSNAYVMAPNREFGDNDGKNAILSADALYRVHLAQFMQELLYQSYDSDPDPWMKLQFRLEDKLEYKSYISFYVEYILCIHHDSDYLLIKLNCYTPIEPSSVSSFDVYLGTILKHM